MPKKNEAVKHTNRQHYYADFKNTTDSRYILVFDAEGVLIDSHIRNTNSDTYALKVLEQKYGPLVKLSAIPPLSHLPVLDQYLELVQEQTGKWDAKWRKVEGTPELEEAITDKQPGKIESKTPKRFILRNIFNEEKTGEGVLWTNGTVSTVVNGLHQSFVNLEEFRKLRLSPYSLTTELFWIDDDIKSKAATNKILQLTKEATAISRIASELIDTMSGGK